MEKNELLCVMDDLLVSLDELRDAAFKKQRALIANNYEQIEHSLAQEEKVLGTLQAIQKRRTNILETFAQKLSLNVNHKKFGDFLKTVKGKIDTELYETLVEKNNTLGMLLSNINLLNLQNRYLTEQVRSFNRSLINQLFGNKNRTILDRKI